MTGLTNEQLQKACLYATNETLVRDQDLYPEMPHQSETPEVPTP